MLRRGNHPLPHQSQITERDLTGEEIAAHLGGESYGVSLTEDEIKRRPHALPYRFVLQSPASAALAWTAFYDENALRAFCDAYGLTIDGSIAPGSNFRVRLPPSVNAFQPLTDDGVTYM